MRLIFIDIMVYLADPSHLLWLLLLSWQVLHIIFHVSQVLSHRIHRLSIRLEILLRTFLSLILLSYLLQLLRHFDLTFNFLHLLHLSISILAWVLLPRVLLFILFDDSLLLLLRIHLLHRINRIRVLGGWVLFLKVCIVLIVLL